MPASLRSYLVQYDGQYDPHAISASLALYTTVAVTMPVDVVKTRLQMDGSGGNAKRLNMIH